MVSTMTPTLCCWNVRGLGLPQKCSDVLAELIQFKTNASFLQETKLATLDSHKARSFLPRGLDIIQRKNYTGSSGGILSALSSLHFTLISYSATDYTNTVIVGTLASPLHLHITNVYAPSDHSLKQSFLDELASIAPPSHTPWLLLGDFILMRHAHDKNNSAFRQNEADLFNQYINSLSLLELPLLDRAFTWSNKRDHPTLERLDRVFVNPAWDSLFPNSS